MRRASSLSLCLSCPDFNHEEWLLVRGAFTFPEPLKATGNAMFEQLLNLQSWGGEHPLLQLHSGKVCDILSLPVCREIPTKWKIQYNYLYVRWMVTGETWIKRRFRVLVLQGTLVFHEIIVISYSLIHLEKLLTQAFLVVIVFFLKWKNILQNHQIGGKVFLKTNEFSNEIHRWELFLRFKHIWHFK